MNFFYYLRMFRIKDWVLSFFWVPLVGAVSVSSSPKTILIIATISFCILAYAFIINNYFDTEIDRKHRKKVVSNKNPLAQGFISQKGTLSITMILLIFSFILAITISLYGFFLILLSIIASTSYSIKHIRLKERPGADIITHGLMFGFLPFLAGIILGGGVIDFRFLFIGLLFFLLNCNALLSHQIVDYEEDLGNTKSTVIRIGRKTSFIILILFQFIFLLGFTMLGRYFFISPWINSLFIFLLFLIPLDCVRRTVKGNNQLMIKNS